jgi:sec-independent protein translocase protein TatA
MGFGELLLILVLVLLFFGAGKLPALGEGLGKAFRGFKDAVGGGTPQKPAASSEPKKELPPRP